MTLETYFMVNIVTNICDNICVWDGDEKSWTPPINYVLLQQSKTLSKNWKFDAFTKQWILSVSGTGSVGYVWDGAYLITNLEQPDIQPVVSGAQTL